MILAKDISVVWVAGGGRIPIKRGSFGTVKARIVTGGPVEEWWEAFLPDGCQVSGPRDHLVMVGTLAPNLMERVDGTEPTADGSVPR